MPQDNQNSSQKQEKPQLSALDTGISNFRRMKNIIVESWEKLSNLEQTNFALAVKYMSMGYYKDAALRLRFVLWLNPKNPYAHYLLGKSYVYAGKRDKAVAPLKVALKAKPDLEEAAFFLSVCGVGGVPERVPPSLVIEQLEILAPVYEEQIAEESNRPIYMLGTKILSEQLDGKQGFDVLDLDIRVGKTGEYILPFANHIVGVEPCMHMISQARNRRVNDRLVYNELITKTSKDQLRKEERKFDIVQSYFTTTSYGSLQELFELIKAHLRPNGLLLLAVEGANGEGFVFSTTKMTFQHSAPYIEKIAQKNGFEVIRQEKLNYVGNAFDLVFLLKAK